MIQFRIIGTNNKGDVVCDENRENVSWDSFHSSLCALRRRHEDAISFSIQVSFLDPEFVKIKMIICVIIKEENFKQSSILTTVDLLFNAVDIKLKGEHNA